MLHFVDASRSAWNGHAPRPLIGAFWYPATSDSKETDWNADVFRFGEVAPNAPFADSTKHPLILLSHGTGGSAAQLSWLAEALVQRGYVVAALNHHGNTAAEDAYAPQGFVTPWERARDLSALIDKLLADPQIASHVDASRIGAAGFSIGGYTVLALAGAHESFEQFMARCRTQADSTPCKLPPESFISMQQLNALAVNDAVFKASLARGQEPFSDTRVRAVFAIAPAMVSLLNHDALAGVHVPVEIVLGGSDEQIPHDATAAEVARDLPTAKVVTIPALNHYVFLAPCTLRGKFFVPLCKDHAGVDRVKIHEQVANDAAGFFAARLD